MKPKSSPRPTPVTPDAMRIAQALQESAPLARLQQRVQESNARLAVIRTALPPGMSAHVKAGPVDDTGWSLLAPNAAVAAKLRQLQPILEQRLREHGWANHTIRVKVQ